MSVHPPTRRLGRALASVAAVVLAAVTALLGLAGVAQAAGSCNGAQPTPGSGDVTKQLVGGTLVPGGTAEFKLDYPAGGGRFTITDCLYVDGVLAEGPTEYAGGPGAFTYTYTYTIASTTKLGAQICNVAKTTGSGGNNSGGGGGNSNRKAVSCFFAGGSLRVDKVDAAGGALLPGATFTVACTPPQAYPPVVISGVGSADVTGSTGTVTAAGEVGSGRIALSGPVTTPCTITETAPPPGYDLPAQPTQSATIPDASATDAPVVVGFADVAETGRVKIAKTADAAGTFGFTVDCGSAGTFSPSVTVTGSGTSYAGDATSDPLPAGVDCDVTETADANWTSTPAGAQHLSVPADSTATASFANIRKTGRFTVAKTVTGGKDGTFSFAVDCTGTAYDTTASVTTSGGSGSWTSDLLPTGTVCTVTENPAAGYTSTLTSASNTVTVTDGSTPQVEFANAPVTGSLVVTKSTDVDGTVSFTVDCAGTAYDATASITTSGGSGSWTSGTIPAGTTCTVSENAPAGYTVSPSSGQVQVSIPANGTATAAFTNTRQRATFTLTKTADAAGTFVFDVDCDGTAYDRAGTNPVTLTTSANALTATWTSDPLPTGTACTVTERADADWTVAPAAGQTLTVGTDDGVTFANTRRTGTLTLRKSADVDGTFAFSLSCDNGYTAAPTITTVSGAGSWTSPALPTGTLCRASETPSPDYTSQVVTPDTVTIAAGDSNAVGFANTHATGLLTIAKTADADGTFAFDVTCDNGFTATGVAISTVNGSGEKSVGPITTGATCSVREQPNPAYTSSPTTPTTVVVAATGTRVGFRNTLRTNPPPPAGSPKLTLVKSADPPAGTIVQPGQRITYTLGYANTGNAGATGVTVDDPLPDGTSYVSILDGGSFAAGVASWALGSVAPGATGTLRWTVQVASGLPAGTVLRNVATVGGVTSNPVEHPVASGALTLVKAVDKTSVRYGGTLTYTLTATATGTVDQTGAVVSDVLPVDTTYVAGSAACVGSPCTAGYDAGSRTVSWALGDLAAGASRQVSFAVTVDTPTPAADGSIPARVVVNVGSVRSTRTDPTPSNTVRTPVVAVLGEKVVKPPAGRPPASNPPATNPPTAGPITGPTGGRGPLPFTGPGLPVGPASTVALTLVGVGVLLSSVRRRRT